MNIFYIITRFNLRLWPHDKRGNQTQTEEWLKERFRLFESYCLPSIAGQTSKDFTWIVLFDSETPEEYTSRFGRYKLLCPQFTPVMVQPKVSRKFKTFIPQIVIEDIKKRYDNCESFRLITTYLDNDDALRNDYVAETARLAGEVGNNTFISYVKGLQYYTELNIAVSFRYKTNHFISFVETIENTSNTIKTVYGFGSHDDIDKFGNCQCLYLDNQNPKWLEVVHTNNIDNDIRLKFRFSLVTDLLCLKPFGIDNVLSKQSRKIFYTKFVVRSYKELIRHIRYKIYGRNWWK